jgi:3-dehydroquinate synthetase
VIELAAAERLGFTPAGTSERARALFERFGLPTAIDAATVAAAWPYVMSDKKRALSALKLPVVTGPGEGRVERVELDALRAAVLA